MTDRGLIEQYVLHNSQAAFSQLVQRHAALVYSTCKRDLGDVVLAEDCTQAVFLILARTANRPLRIDSLTGWLFKTARLAARDAIKQEVRRRRREAAIMDLAQVHVDDDTAAWQAIEPELNDTLAAMAAADRDVILMRFVEQFSHADIAQSLGIKEDAARVRVSRAVDRLRVKLTSRTDKIAGVLSGVALADLLASRAVDAASADFAAHLAKISHWPTSLSTAGTGPEPHAHSIAQGAMRAMSRTRNLKIATAGVVIAGAAVVALSPLGARANLVGPVRLMMNVLPPPSTAPAPSPSAASAAPADTDTAAPNVGYTETYVFKENDAVIGRQTATLTALT